MTTTEENPLVISRCITTARWAAAHAAIVAATHAAEAAEASEATLAALDSAAAAILAEYTAAHELRLDPPPNVHSVDHEGTWWREPA